MKEQKISNQQMVYHIIPDTMFVRMNQLADEISVNKKIALAKANKEFDRTQSAKKLKKFTNIAKGLMTTEQIVYKGNQRFNLEEVEFADSRGRTKKSNKHSRRNPTNHVAKVSEVISN